MIIEYNNPWLLSKNVHKFKFNIRFILKNKNT